MNPLPDFVPSRPYTIGVEVELQLIDKYSFNLSQVAPEVLSRVPVTFKNKIKPEFIQSMVEIATGVCRDIDEVADDMRTSFQMLTDLAKASNCLVFAAGLHPFAHYQDQKITQGRRYAQLMQELQIAGKRMISQGLHVHIGLPDRETLIKVCDGIRPYLPLLLALSTSSPYYGGVHTGFFSYRSRLLDALSRSGLPYTFRNWDNYNKLVADLHNAGLIEDVRDIWWDVRPHPDLGTVEIRICDVPVSFAETLALASLIQALVKTLAEAPEINLFPRLEIISNNKWQASRHGLDGKFIDLDNISVPLTIRKAIVNTMRFCEKSIQFFQTEKHMEKIQDILKNGTGTHKMNKYIQDNMNFTDCIEKLRGDFWT